MNPWTKKNPALSLWLSGANAMFGAARAHGTAAMHRHTALMMAEGTRQVMRFWTGAWMAPTAPVKRTRRSPRARTKA